MESEHVERLRHSGRSYQSMADATPNEDARGFFLSLRQREDELADYIENLEQEVQKWKERAADRDFEAQQWAEKKWAAEEERDALLDDLQCWQERCAND